PLQRVDDATKSGFYDDARLHLGDVELLRHDVDQVRLGHRVARGVRITHRRAPSDRSLAARSREVKDTRRDKGQARTAKRTGTETGTDTDTASAGIGDG